ncbi:uncharacterized protein A4U43_C01F5330 [Asparagus officinalis]|uniref:NB-ARC domain-containing protein n=1 Tax=Asparagus officinalis TaxID=4686 RepID=A0A5P1FLZ5_ASPOF|nr:uncharacterized protein A4U43_C01F5330 [Asparagus officinalis]
MIERLGSELQTNPDLEGMKKILTLSYNDLPYNVKRCFLYLGKFPEDCLIKRKRVQGLWIAEGLISDRHDMTDEEVSESYFNELANRYMILPSTFSADGKIRDFRVHDVMLELIVSKSMEDNFLTVIETDDRCMPCDAIRRLSIHGKQYQWIKSSLTCVRSYTLFVGRHDVFISSSMRRLRVLDLEGCRASNLAYVLSKVITVELLHLKYLSLRNTELRELPKSLGNLRCLETLDIVGTDVWKIPRGITKLLHLRFLRGGGIKVPEGTGNLRSLQELTIVDVGRRGVMKELDKLAKLKKLALKLDSTGLHPQTANSSCFLFLLDSLSSPPLLLESLGLHGELGKMPNWIGLLSNLQKLSLERSNLDNDSLKALGTLPNLLQLNLRHLASQDDVLSFASQGFPSLKVLVLRKLRLWSLNFEEEAMPSLEWLSVEDERSANFRISGIKNLTRPSQGN